MATDTFALIAADAEVRLANLTAELADAANPAHEAEIRRAIADTAETLALASVEVRECDRCGEVTIVAADPETGGWSCLTRC